jgi:hypothetical protein
MRIPEDLRCLVHSVTLILVKLKIDPRVQPIAESSWQFKHTVIGSENDDVPC